MRYALISDIHANLPALKSVYGHITERADIDAIYHLGDLVGYAPWPNEVVDLITTHGIGGRGGQLRLHCRYRLQALRLSV